MKMPLEGNKKGTVRVRTIHEKTDLVDSIILRHLDRLIQYLIQQ